MNERKLEKRIEFQKKMIARQSEQIESLKMQIDNLVFECQEKDEIINSIEPLRAELTENINKINEYKKQYRDSIDELKKMKDIFNQEVYKGRWNLVKFLIK